MTILRKRPAFRLAFDGFSIEAVARYDAADVRRLLADPGIVRNRAKIEAVIANARVAQIVEGGLAALVWSFAPAKSPPAPRALADIPARTAESAAMAMELKSRGFRFVGPTTAYALMQACGLVNDHLGGCSGRGP